MAASTRRHSVHQLKITLEGTKPPVWRQLRVPSGVNLRRLHGIFQLAMGWTDSHLYEFDALGGRFGEPDPDFGFEEVRPAQRTRLDQIAPHAGAEFFYIYDFGDDWRHQVVVERVVAAEEDAQYPLCLSGERACPPEDCGGVWGYRELLKILKRPNHPEHAKWLEWVGGHFDPEAFDLADVNEGLRLSRQGALSVLG